jgi:hypothetical protein
LIDLDQKIMEEQVGFLNADSFAVAQKIYEQGGNSKSFATLTLTSPLETAATVGVALNGETDAGTEAYGTAYEAAASGATELKVLYTLSKEIESATACRVGGLPTTSTIMTGCK